MTKAELLEGLKRGWVICIISSDAPEVLADLRALEAEGQIQSTEQDGLVRFERKP